MARARNIKPSFFTNDKLADCDFSARLLFIGLWTIADRAGRLEYRPKKIKAEILPYDNCDCEKLLLQLSKRGFIVIYNVSNIEYIQIVNFEKHQNPHIKESASTIPAPDSHGANTIQAQPLTDSLLLIPDPLQKDITKVISKKRATQLGENWELPQEWGDWAETLGMNGGDIIFQADKFKDYWIGCGKAKSDWQATWRNWIRSHLERKKQ